MKIRCFTFFFCSFVAQEAEAEGKVEVKREREEDKKFIRKLISYVTMHFIIWLFPFNFETYYRRLFVFFLFALLFAQHCSRALPRCSSAALVRSVISMKSKLNYYVTV